ncbi:MAG: NAD(P)-binding domain-containing protein [Acidimicrobiales bacterium]
MTIAAVTIGVLHPGEMGAAVGAEARRGGARVVWCPTGRSQATAARARRAGLEPVDDLAKLLNMVDIVLAICPPTAAQQVAIQVAQHGYKGLYVEANATSPQRCRRIAERFARSGAHVLDAAIFGPPPRAGVSDAALYLAGQRTDQETVADIFADTAVEPIRVDGDIGAASALKMAYSGYQKSARVLAAMAHALAARHGVTKHLIAEARHDTTSPLGEPDQLRSIAALAWRWTPELHEIADALDGDELPTDLALGVASILFRWHDDKDNWNLPLDTVLARLTNTI